MEEIPGLRQRWGAVSFQRRRFPRIDVTLPVEYTVLSDDARSGPSRMVVARNISDGGLLLILPDFHPESTRLSLRIHFPASSSAASPLTSVEAEVRVVWTELRTGLERNEYRCGVHFARIEEGDLERVRAFIREQMEPCP